VIFEHDTSEDEDMFFGQGMPSIVLNIIASLKYYFTELLMLQITPDFEREVEIEIREDEDYQDLIRMMMSIKTYQKAQTCSRMKKIADYVVRKNSSMNLRGYAARKER
jgi:hypothetical protein